MVAGLGRGVRGGLATFDDLIYGGPLTSGYRPGEIRFSLAAIPRNARFMPVHLVEAMPVLVLGLAALAWIAGRHWRLRRSGGARAALARRDLAVGLALAASWCAVWGLYAAYGWTAEPGLSTLQAVRFYVPALGVIALLASWLVVSVPPRAALAALTSAAVAAALFGLGLWGFADLRDHAFLGPRHAGGPHGRVARPGVPHAIPGRGNTRERRGVINDVSTYIDAAGDARPANLVLVEQSGAKHEIPQSSPGDGMIEAEQVMHDPGLHLREVKVVSEHRAIARWKASEFGWRRVA